jgi:hypothetical protein
MKLRILAFIVFLLVLISSFAQEKKIKLKKNCIFAKIEFI